MLARKKISPSDSPKSYSMFLSPITVQESSDWFLKGGFYLKKVHFFK